MREKLESRIEILLICRKEKLDQYYIDLAQFSGQAGDSNTLKDVCDKPQVLQGVRIFLLFMKRKSLKGSRDLF